MREFKRTIRKLEEVLTKAFDNILKIVVFLFIGAVFFVLIWMRLESFFVEETRHKYKLTIMLEEEVFEGSKADIISFNKISETDSSATYDGRARIFKQEKDTLRKTFEFTVTTRGLFRSSYGDLMLREEE